MDACGHAGVIQKARCHRVPSCVLRTCCQRGVEAYPQLLPLNVFRTSSRFPISTTVQRFDLGGLEDVQQLTTATITITANTTNRNVPDSVFIATAGLTPRRAIIKPKVSRLPRLLRSCSQRQQAARLGLGVVATGSALRDVDCCNENGLARICLSEALSRVGCGDARVRDPGHVNGDRVSERDQMDHR